MIDLTTPTDHADAYVWLVVLMAHAGVGLVIVAALSAAGDRLADGAGGVGTAAWIAAVLGYGLIWEGAVQGYAAGWADAGVDTFAVAAGAFIGLAVWHHRAILVAMALASFAIVAAVGVRKRNK
jgi:hypothetical protein